MLVGISISYEFRRRRRRRLSVIIRRSLSSHRRVRTARNFLRSSPSIVAITRRRYVGLSEITERRRPEVSQNSHVTGEFLNRL